MLKYMLCAVVMFMLVSAGLGQVPDSTAKPEFDVAPWPLEVFFKEPEFPELAKAANVPGTVTAVVTLDRLGNVLDCMVTPSTKGLGFDTAVVNVVREWRFSPAIKKGKAVKATVTLSFRFMFAYNHYDSLGRVVYPATHDSLRTAAEGRNGLRRDDPSIAYAPPPILYYPPLVRWEIDRVRRVSRAPISPEPTKSRKTGKAED